MKSKRLARSTDRARQSIIRSADKSRPAIIEVLEERQMLSLTIDLQVAGSSNPKVATVSSVGQVVTIDEYATISGTTSGTNDELWEIDGSLLSSKTDTGSVNGNLSNTVDYPFNTGLSWSNGTVQDLNGDGNLDVGSNDNADATGFIVARAGGPVGSNYGTVSGDSTTWLVSTLTYTVTKLNVGESTDVNWRFRDGLDAGAYDAIWVQDGNALNDATGTVGEAAPVVISDPALIPPTTGSISGTVSKSVNGTTSAFGGVTMYLDLNDSGTLTGSDPTSVTGSSGNYSFPTLTDGTYYLREVVPSGYKQTSPSTSPTLITVTGDEAVTEDFTDTATTVTNNASISGTVYKAASGASTVGFSGVTVYLDLGDKGSFESGDPSTTTSSSGAFSFTGLAAGTYDVRQDVPSGYSQTSPSSTPTVITLSAGQASTGDNFTDTAKTVANSTSIAGTVYKAASGVSTTGFSGVTVYLDLTDAGVFKTGDPSTLTSSSGGFSFTGLAAGTYYLREEVPSGYTQTSPSTSPTKITLSAGQSSTGDNFTDTATSYIPGSISGTVYVDKSGSGKLASGDTGIGNVEMYLDLNKDDKIDSGDPIVTTNSSGAFTFTGLAPGVYRLREVVLNGYSITNTSVGYFDVTIKSNYQITGENFLDKITTPNGVILSGDVFNDANDNGVRDAGERGLSGWVVYIDLNDSGKFESIDNNKTTDSNGNFSFVSLKPGTYYVRVIPVSGYSETVPSSGYYKVTLVAGTPTTIDFGEHQTGATSSTGGGTTTNGQTLSGDVFEDLTGSGVQTSSDPGLGGWVVYCDLNDSGTFQSDDNNKTTTSNGDFSFVSLKPGTYIIRVIPESGYKETDPASGFYTVTLSAGGTVTGIDFGEEKT